MIDMSVPGIILERCKHQIPRVKLCDSCHKGLAELSIWNPNGFPANDFEVRGSIWDVCPGCRRFIELIITREMEKKVEEGHK